MSDNLLRHVIAATATLVAFLAYVAGYTSAGFGWWWTVISVGIIYVALYKIVDA